jgi:hypothetical protein
VIGEIFGSGNVGATRCSDVTVRVSYSLAMQERCGISATWLLCMVAALGTPSGYAQSVLRVPADHATVQAAINASANGDTVEVAPGTYTENIRFNGKAIRLVSQSGPASTIIEPAAFGSLVTLQNNETTTSILEGFTLRNGRGSLGGAMELFNASPTIRDNIFIGNGSAIIWGNNASPLIERNLFLANSCGTGVETVNGSSPRIVNNVFADNTGCTAISMTLPEGNMPVVANNTVVRNRVGIHVDGRIDTTLQIYRSNLVFGNQVGLEVMFASFPNSYPTWQNNLVFGNVLNYDGIPVATGSNGNISADPLLTGLDASDYQVDTGSAAIDKGLNSEVATGERDYYKRTRIVDGDLSGISTVDIGAAEFSSNQPAVAIGSSQAEIPIGSSVTIAWTSSNHLGCVASGAWSGSKQASGTETITPTASGTLLYVLTCSSSAGNRSRAAKVLVHPRPSITMSINPTAIPIGQSAYLQWNTTNATSCTAAGGLTGQQPTNGAANVVPTAAGTVNYMLTCSGPGGSSVATVPLTVYPLPTIVLIISPQQIPVGSGAQVTWSTQDATGCAASGAWTGDRAIAGNLVLSAVPAGIYTYVLTCSGLGGSAASGATLEVVPPPFVSIVASPALLAIGASVMVTWNSFQATGCVANGAWTGTQPQAGQMSFQMPTAGVRTFGLTCTGIGGSTTSSTVVTVYGRPTVSISLTTTSINVGQSATLTWGSADATSCLASDGWSGVQATSGTLTVSPATVGTTTYALACNGPGGTANGSISLNVSAAAASGGGGGMDPLALLMLVLVGLSVSLRLPRRTG